MSNITAAEVNKLRQETGAGIMDCKKALIETNGDFEAAIDFLRKKGAKIAANRSDREANEGVVVALTSEDGKFGCAVNLSSETDFVAKNEDFVNLAKAIADVALKNRIKTVEDLNNAELDGVSIKDKLLDTVAKIGEKIEVKKYEVLEGEGVVAYIHMGYRMGVLVQLNKALDEAITVAGKDVAMQIAAMNPVAVDGSGVSDEMKERERAIAREKAIAAGKPENILDKIADGAVNTMLKENTLLPQAFVKDGSKTVEQYLKSVDKDLTVVSFKRVTLS
ncbi:MAG TPA: translation elongation factor Ts [Chitinophagales bacterium]|jgi:elongation factor Ts|nr:elongation factor Ts [Chitinophagales bacterium]HPA36368.1 translation elongation factor Ts [Chitinophagales bacterium]HPW85661.1 translation elongation factor Ts [Chitinophagales bacterium]HQD12110.1 translation elongation factor Ts [Chitinophagales bacterium]HQO32468.1 translation elongation factor Ts [Chitinophagales bacterium]